MKNEKRKSVISRMFSLMAVVLSLGMILTFTAVSASAAEAQAAEIITMEVQADTGMKFTPVANVTVMANQQQQTTTASNADTSFDSMIDFITTWFTRIGLAVGLVGGIMFGLAIKDDNADGKQRGLMTLVAGLVVAAICAAARTMFPGL